MSVVSIEWTPAAALGLATFGHSGQVDKLGRPYVGHVTAVGVEARRLYLTGEIERPGTRYPDRQPSRWATQFEIRGLPDDETADLVEMAGYLHDVVEDGRINNSLLWSYEAPRRLIHAVELLDHRCYPDRGSYIRAIAADPDPVAWFVKHADNWHNSHPIRLADVARRAPRTADRLDAKYAQDREWLGTTRDRKVA